MARTLRISKAHGKDFDDIEDVDQLLADINSSSIPEEPPELENHIVGGNEDKPVPIYDVRKATNPPPNSKYVQVRAKGKRNIIIKELDIDIIPPTSEKFKDPDHTGSKVVVIGKPGTGKSNLIRSVAYEKSDIIPVAQVYSGTEDSNHAYANYIPNVYIFNKFSQSNYLEFVKRQKLAKKYLNNPWGLNIWDDITEDERIFNLPIVKGTYKNGRHWKMLHICALQYCLDMRPVIRTNIDGTFLLRETIKRNRQVLFQNYASAIDDYGDFCDIMDTITNDFTSLYIHNRTSSNDADDVLFYYKARNDIPANFKFGCSEIWMANAERYNEMYVDPIEI